MEVPAYILFIDTETSGMPRHWSNPTQKTEKWPYILQIAWIVCTWEGQQVTVRNFYIETGPIDIDLTSQKLHGITPEFLEEHGKKRKTVMKLLAKDLERYQPLIVGHFLEFDKRMMEVGFTRAKVAQNFKHLPKFCTMIFSKSLRTGSFTPTYMRLDELHRFLFGVPPENYHNALNDALSTKACFLALKDRGLINPDLIEDQQSQFRSGTGKKLWPVLTVAGLILIAILILIIKLIFNQ